VTLSAGRLGKRFPHRVDFSKMEKTLDNWKNVGYDLPTACAGGLSGFFSIKDFA